MQPLVSYSKSFTVKEKIYVKNAGWVDNTVVYALRSGLKQKPPFNIDTVYSYSDNRTLKGWGRDLPGTAVSKSAELGAVNMARAKMISQLGDSSSFGATLTAELKSTWGTVYGGIATALRAANAVRRGKLVKAADILGFHPPTVSIVKTYKVKTKKSKRVIRTTTSDHWVMPDGRMVSQKAANSWLWFSYGVKPLVSDIQNGMDVLTRPLSFTRIEGKGFNQLSWSGPNDSSQVKYKAKTSVCISVNVRVANPNLWLANQLGLTNPVQWINEAIPFSFVVDWFSNVSQVISQMSDFDGLEIARPITTIKHVGERSTTYPEYGGLVSVTQQTFFTRDMSLPQAKLRFAYERFQWQRGANAISLLVGFMKKSPLKLN